MNLKNQGSFLILALWSLSLLAAFSISLGYSVRQKATLLARINTYENLYPITYSGIEAARDLLKAGDQAPRTNTLSDEWAKNNSRFKEIRLGERGSFSVSYQMLVPEQKETVIIYGLVDEQSKININTSDAATLTRILQIAAGLDKDMAEEMAYCIIDWRDSDSTFQHASYGAEDDYYNHLEVSYGAKNAPFEVLDELLVVKGISREIFNKIKPYLTAYGTGHVNVNTAPKEVLLALGLEDRLVEKLLNYRRGEDREDRTVDDRGFSQSSSIATELAKSTAIDAAETAALEALISTGKLGTFSTQFFVHSHGILTMNGAYLDMESVIDRKGKIYYLRTSKVQWPSQV